MLNFSLIATSGASWSAVTDGAENVIDLSSSMLTTILANPIFATVFAASFVYLGIRLVKSLKRG